MPEVAARLDGDDGKMDGAPDAMVIDIPDRRGVPLLKVTPPSAIYSGLGRTISPDNLSSSRLVKSSWDVNTDEEEDDDVEKLPLANLLRGNDTSVNGNVGQTNRAVSPAPVVVAPNSEPDTTKIVDEESRPLAAAIAAVDENEASTRESLAEKANDVGKETSGSDDVLKKAPIPESQMPISDSVLLDSAETKQEAGRDRSTPEEDGIKESSSSTEGTPSAPLPWFKRLPVPWQTASPVMQQPAKTDPIPNTATDAAEPPKNNDAEKENMAEKAEEDVPLASVASSLGVLLVASAPPPRAPSPTAPSPRKRVPFVSQVSPTTERPPYPLGVPHIRGPSSASSAPTTGGGLITAPRSATPTGTVETGLMRPRRYFDDDFLHDLNRESKARQRARGRGVAYQGGSKGGYLAVPSSGGSASGGSQGKSVTSSVKPRGHVRIRSSPTTGNESSSDDVPLIALLDKRKPPRYANGIHLRIDTSSSLRSGYSASLSGSGSNMSTSSKKYPQYPPGSLLAQKNKEAKNKTQMPGRGQPTPPPPPPVVQQVFPPTYPVWQRVPSPMPAYPVAYTPPLGFPQTGVFYPPNPYPGVPHPQLANQMRSPSPIMMTPAFSDRGPSIDDDRSSSSRRARSRSRVRGDEGGEASPRSQSRTRSHSRSRSEGDGGVPTTSRERSRSTDSSKRRTRHNQADAHAKMHDEFIKLRQRDWMLGTGIASPSASASVAGSSSSLRG
ncbi:hypothetical protein HK104_006511, partial [Borealophlyctis nickersoniae]